MEWIYLYFTYIYLKWAWFKYFFSIMPPKFHRDEWMQIDALERNISHRQLSGWSSLIQPSQDFPYVTHEVRKAKVIFGKPHSSYQLQPPSSSLLTVFLLLRAALSLSLKYLFTLISSALTHLVQCQTFLLVIKTCLPLSPVSRDSVTAWQGVGRWGKHVNCFNFICG